MSTPVLMLPMIRPRPLDTGYWATSPYPNTEGLLAIDDTYASIIPNTTAYGTDITVQNINVSADWDVVAVGSAASGGQSQPALTAQERTWVSYSAMAIDVNDTMTTGGAWTEDGRLPVPLDTGHRIRVTFTARRADGVGYYHAQSAGLAYNDGGTVTVSDSSIFEETTDPALETRMVADGQDMVFEVKGQGGQDWRWETVFFSKEIL